MIFVDSSYYIARLLVDDKFHNRAKEIEGQLTEKRVINNTVLTETLNTFTNCGGKSVKKLFNVLTEVNDLVFLSPSDYLNAGDIFYYYDSSINYSDCTILQSMQNLGINKIVSFDEDFSKVKGLSVIK